MQGCWQSQREICVHLLQRWETKPHKLHAQESFFTLNIDFFFLLGLSTFWDGTMFLCFSPALWLLFLARIGIWVLIFFWPVWQIECKPLIPRETWGDGVDVRLSLRPFQFKPSYDLKKKSNPSLQFLNLMQATGFDTFSGVYRVWGVAKEEESDFCSVGAIEWGSMCQHESSQSLPAEERLTSLRLRGFWKTSAKRC